ncbi:MAG: hypothetical protein M3Y77_21785, partial [Actinomycetota bacterium]|nr:hypothetical protein [Actinomycetota bacterium]
MNHVERRASIDHDLVTTTGPGPPEGQRSCPCWSVAALRQDDEVERSGGSPRDEGLAMILRQRDDAELELSIAGSP